MKKYLQLYKPLIATLPEIGNLFSLLDINNSNVKSWINSSFFHIYSNIHNNKYKDVYTTFLEHNTMLRECPFTECIFSDNYFNDYPDKSIVEFIINSINDGYYIIILLNNFYISKSKIDFNHMTLISGYNLDTKEFTISDFTNGNYGITTYSFHEVENGFNNLILEPYTILGDDPRSVLQIKPTYHINNIGLKHNFDITYFTKELILFLNPPWTTYSIYYKGSHISHDVLYNHDAKKYIIKSIQNNIPNSIDVRVFCIYHDHIVLLENKLNYLVANKYLTFDVSYTEVISKLKSEYYLLILLALKYQAKNSNKIIVSIVRILSSCVEQEKCFIKRIANQLIDENNLQLEK